MNEQFVHSSKLVWVDCVVLRAFEVGRNQEFLKRRLFSQRKVHVLCIDVESKLNWRGIDILGYDAYRSDFDLREERHDQQCLAVALGSDEVALLEAEIVLAEQCLSWF